MKQEKIRPQEIEEIINLLKENKIDQAAKMSKKFTPYRLTGVLGDFPLEIIEEFIQKIDPELSADILNQFPEEFAGNIIMFMENEDLFPIIKKMTGDELVDFFPHLTEQKIKAITEFLPQNIKEEIDYLSRYEEDLVGAYMEQDFISVNSDETVGNVFNIVKEAPADIEHTDYIYVIDENKKLRGVVSLKDLMFSNREKGIDKIMQKDLITVTPSDDALETAHRLRSRRLNMLPVVDKRGVIRGIITIEKAVNLLSENIAEDMVAFSGSSREESFFTRSAESIKLRLPWMAANIFLNLGAVSVISNFEDTIAQIAILAAFLPMITDMGGNVGIQALSVSIRSLALGEAQLRDVARALKKEIKIGLVNGIVLGLIFASLAYVFQSNFVLAFVAGAALGVNVLVAGAIGGTMPFLIKKIGRDPAMMTGPVLTTITDITGVSIYLGLSTLFLVYIL